VIGIVREVVPDEYVEAVRVAPEAGLDQNDELTVTGGVGQLVSAGEVGVVGGQQGGRGEKRRLLRAASQGEYLVGCCWVPADQP
jgi:hypothetical protein